MNIRTYRFSVCKLDGSTPLGKCPIIYIDAEDYYEALLKLHNENPGHEVVSWGPAPEVLSIKTPL